MHIYLYIYIDPTSNLLLTIYALYIWKKLNLPQQVLKNTYILTNKFNISGVGLFLMKSTLTVLIQIEDRGLNEDIELVNLLRSWTLKTKCPE